MFVLKAKFTGSFDLCLVGTTSYQNKHFRPTFFDDKNFGALVLFDYDPDLDDYYLTPLTSSPRIQQSGGEI